MPKHFTYGAFLSYSPVNAGVAGRVGRRLEQLRIDRGPVRRPARVGPVFRDRCEIFARACLGGETVAALADSAALIVLASPHSAQSQYANRQVALFKLQHPERPVISLLVEGPDSAEPRFAVVPDWCKRLADAAPLDLDEGDGLDLAVAKIAGRLLGGSPHEVSEGHERARHRRGWICTVTALVATVLVTAAGAALWQSHRQARAWADVARLIEKYERATPTRAADPGAKESLIRAFTAMAEDGKRDPRYFQVLELLNAGKLVESEKLLGALAGEKARRSAREGAAAYRMLASVAAISDPAWAREYYAEATRLDPSNVEGLFRNGWLLQAAGQVDAAEASYRRLTASVRANNDQWALWAYLATGDIERERGHFDDALANYQAADDIAESLAEIDAGNSRWQYDIAVIHQHIGDLLFGLGDRANALQHYRAQETVLSHLGGVDPADRGRGPLMAPVRVADGPVPRDGAGAMLASFRGSLAHLERLAKADRTDAGRQRDLAIAYARTGSLLMWQDNLPEALSYFSANLSILDRLGRLDPGNVRWQRDLAVAYVRIGDLAAEQDDLAGAVASYQTGLAITDRLLKIDPGNLRWKRDLARTHRSMGDVLVRQDKLSEALKFYQTNLEMTEPSGESADTAAWRETAGIHHKMGDILARQRQPAEALKSYSAALAIVKHLAAAAPEDLDRQAELAEIYETIGKVLRAGGDLAEAVKSYQAGLAIAERLIKADPAGGERQHDVAVTHRTVGDMLKALGDLAGALKSFRDSLAIAQRMRANGLDNSGLRREVAATSFEIGDVLQLQGKLPDAHKSYAASLAIMSELTKGEPGRDDWQRDLAVTHSAVGDVLKTQGKLREALKSYQASVAILERLAKANSEWQRDLSVTYVRLADFYRTSGQPAKARQAFAAGRAIMARLVAQFPQQAKLKQEYAWFDAQKSTQLK